MKRILIILAMSLIVGRATAPPNDRIYLPEANQIKPFERAWQAVCIVESNNNPRAYNPIEMATGVSQIRPIRLNDYNKRTGKNYKLEDCYDVEISKEIFMYYCSNPYDIEKTCKSWNGSGPKTEEYWSKIEKALKP